MNRGRSRSGSGSTTSPTRSSYSILIIAQKLVLPGSQILSNAFISIRDGKIINISTDLGEHRDKFTEILEADLVTPGFVDIHNHGLGGTDNLFTFWTSDYTCSVLPSKGTTSVLASLTFPKDNVETTRKVLDVLSAKIGIVKPTQSVIEGIHAEGPIVATLGAMPPSDAQMSDSDFERFLSALPGLRVMTISPSLEAKNNYRRIRILMKHGVTPSLGHDLLATEEDVLGALRLSPSKPMHITHLFNVCKFHHRDIGLANFGLVRDFPKLAAFEGAVPPTVELVGDLAHVHPMVLGSTLAARSPSSIAFITDAVMDCKLLHPVSYGINTLEMSADQKKVCLKGTNTLAGSCISLLETFKSLVTIFRVPVEDAVMMVAETPAKIAGLENVGRVGVGKRADLLLFSNELRLQKTLINGRVVYSADSVPNKI